MYLVARPGQNSPIFISRSGLKVYRVRATTRTTARTHKELAVAHPELGGGGAGQVDGVGVVEVLVHHPDLPHQALGLVLPDLQHADVLPAHHDVLGAQAWLVSQSVSQSVSQLVHLQHAEVLPAHHDVLGAQARLVS